MKVKISVLFAILFVFALVLAAAGRTSWILPVAFGCITASLVVDHVWDRSAGD
jgi:hypothetical protein